MRLWVSLLSLIVGACAPTSPDYARIQPVYAFRNAPSPVPAPREKPEKPRYTKRDRKPDSPRPVPQPAATGDITVLPGDTLYRLAQRHGVSPNALIRANQLRRPDHLAVGQQLLLPRNSPAERTTPPSPVPSINIPLSATDFRWPVSGPILSSFGDKGDGRRNDGVNIAAAEGTAIRAAEQGTVLYAGDDLKTFGKLILIRHGAGYVTAYAHTQRTLVVKGDLVRRGEIIGHVGRTGGVTRPQLHFEIRRGRQVLNPVSYLPKRLASR